MYVPRSAGTDLGALLYDYAYVPSIQVLTWAMAYQRPCAGAGKREEDVTITITYGTGPGAYLAYSGTVTAAKRVW